MAPRSTDGAGELVEETACRTRFTRGAAETAETALVARCLCMLVHAEYQGF